MQIRTRLVKLLRITMEAARIASVDSDLDRENRALEASTPEELIAWAHERYGDRLIASPGRR